MTNPAMITNQFTLLNSLFIKISIGNTKFITTMAKKGNL